MLIRRWWALVVLAGCFVVPAHAAESFDQCKYFITQLPLRIEQPGVYCLKGNLQSAITQQSAISVWTNDVTIDCKHFGIDGAAGGANAQTWAITANTRHLTVRNCTLRNFEFGLMISGNEGGIPGLHVIEDNIFEQLRSQAILVTGNGSVIQRNIIRDIGGPTANGASAISAIGSIDILDNFVSNLASGPGNGVAAISVQDSRGLVARNRIRKLYRSGTDHAYGIYVSNQSFDFDDSRVAIRDNELSIEDPERSHAIICWGSTGAISGNVINGFDVALDRCASGGRNDISR